MMTAPRAVRDIEVSADLWPVVDRWAQQPGYRVDEQDNDRRSYKKGSGVMTGSRLVTIATSGRSVHLEACVTANFLARLFSLFILPKEITIESGGMKAVLPRKLGRNEVNDLLQSPGAVRLSPARSSAWRGLAHPGRL